WQVNAIPSSGVAGTNWDLLSAGGGLANANTNGATSSNPFVIDIFASGSVTGFNNANIYTWTAATFSGGITFPQTAFAANPIGWGDLNGGAFSIVVSGNNLNVVYAPVPEPSTILGIAVFALLGGIAVRRGWRKCPAAT